MPYLFVKSSVPEKFTNRDTINWTFLGGATENNLPIRKGVTAMAELTYSRNGDYYIPDLALIEQPDMPIRAWKGNTPQG